MKEIEGIDLPDVIDETGTEMLAEKRRSVAETDEARAKSWNGGPRAMQKGARERYWRKVRKELP